MDWGMANEQGSTIGPVQLENNPKPRAISRKSPAFDSEQAKCTSDRAAADESLEKPMSHERWGERALPTLQKSDFGQQEMPK